MEVYLHKKKHLHHLKNLIDIKNGFQKKKNVRYGGGHRNVFGCEKMDFLNTFQNKNDMNVTNRSEKSSLVNSIRKRHESIETLYKI